MSADTYWRKFIHTVSFLDPCALAGELTARSEDGPKDDPYPVLVLTLDSGYRVRVNVTQTRLLGELIRTRPVVGDRLEIAYHGPAAKAPPGLSPVKEFTVTVTRRNTGPSRPPAQTGNSIGEVSDNASAAGRLSPK